MIYRTRPNIPDYESSRVKEIVTASDKADRNNNLASIGLVALIFGGTAAACVTSSFGPDVFRTISTCVAFVPALMALGALKLYFYKQAEKWGKKTHTLNTLSIEAMRSMPADPRKN